MMGTRVVTPANDVGVVEEIDGDMVRVRLMTPDNTPSAVSSWCLPGELRDGTNVYPQPRGRVWRREAAMFNQAINRALKEAGV